MPVLSGMPGSARVSRVLEHSTLTKRAYSTVHDYDLYLLQVVRLYYTWYWTPYYFYYPRL